MPTDTVVSTYTAEVLMHNQQGDRRWIEMIVLGEIGDHTDRYLIEQATRIANDTVPHGWPSGIPLGIWEYDGRVDRREGR